MGILKLAEKAKNFITGRGRWVADSPVAITNYDQVEDNGVKEVYGYCAMGAVDAALGYTKDKATDEPDRRSVQAAKLVVLLAQACGMKSYKKWQKAEEEDGNYHTPYQDYVIYCRDHVINYNDNGNQRNVGNLFKRVIAKLQREAYERRSKRVINNMLKEAQNAPVTPEVAPIPTEETVH